jgi:hypothetical protein
MTVITLSDGLAKYYSDNAVRTAVETLLSTSGDAIPDHLEWDELRSYYSAVLSAYQIQYEYSIFLMDAWEAIWGEALKTSGLDTTLRRLSFAQAKVDAWTSYALEPTWNEGYFFVPFEADGQHFWFGVCLGEAGLCLGMESYDSNGNSSLTNIALSAEWPESAAVDGTAWTEEKLALISDGDQIDVGRVREVAVDALAAVKDGC